MVVLRSEYNINKYYKKTRKMTFSQQMLQKLITTYVYLSESQFYFLQIMPFG